MPIKYIAGVIMSYKCNDCGKEVLAPDVTKEWLALKNMVNGKDYVLCPSCRKYFKNIEKMANSL
ncbi:MAG: hypothetical protein AAB596_01025 [Patescibacteria group bacterium]